MFPSKLLLFGEYTIIQDSCALAIPYPQYQSWWSDSDAPALIDNTMEEDFSKESLQKILLDLKTLKSPRLNWRQLERDLTQGLWFCSNSPMGYGLGSSGAVCAALYSRYATKKASDLALLKKELALLEHSFHGKSSGIDPLIAYSNTALWVHENKEIESVELPINNSKAAIFLINSETPRVSTPFINFFVEQSELDSFKKDYIQPVSQAVKEVIEALLKGKLDAVFDQIALISELQFMYVPPMITENMRNIWLEGIQTQDFYIKICGAGGGGFFLGFAKDWEMVQPYLVGYAVERLY